MLTITVNDSQTTGKAIQVNIPTNLKEITKEYLKGVTENIEIAEHHALIALCYREKLSTLMLAYQRKKTETQAAVVPLFVKAGKTESDFINNLSCSNMLIMGGSDIALGYHINAPKNQLTLERVMNVLELDKTAYTRFIGRQEYCYFVEFKLVPVNVIHGAYNENTNDYKPEFIMDCEVNK